MSIFANAQLPFDDVIARPKKFENDPNEGKVTDAWVEYLSRLTNAVARSSIRMSAVNLVQQNASIGATDIAFGALPPGLYTVSYYARITTPAGTSSSLTIGWDWTDGGVTISRTEPAITGNTTATIQHYQFLLRIDNASPIRYTTTYASNSAGVMRYSLDIILEQVKL